MNIILFKAIPKVISFTDPVGRHLKKILKAQAGDCLKAGLVNGPRGEVCIEGVEADGYRVSWRESGPAVGLYPLTLLVGFVRPISVKRILREAASLGVGRLIFTVTDTGERSYRQANLWKTGEYREYLINGLQTAGGTVLPEVVLCGGLREALEALGLVEAQTGVAAPGPSGTVESTLRGGAPAAEAGPAGGTAGPANPVVHAEGAAAGPAAVTEAGQECAADESAPGTAEPDSSGGAPAAEAWSAGGTAGPANPVVHAPAAAAGPAAVTEAGPVGPAPARLVLDNVGAGRPLSEIDLAGRKTVVADRQAGRPLAELDLGRCAGSSGPAEVGRPPRRTNPASPDGSLGLAEPAGPPGSAEPRAVVLAVGSERGWSERERGLFKAAGFESASLGSRVLRTETACSAGAALALARMGLL